MKANLVGVDCATAPKNVGLAFGTFSSGSTVVDGACLGASTSLPADIIADWIRDRETPVLIALDAPLGWPAPLADALQFHRAGSKLSATAHHLFRRRTDLVVREKIGKQSLDVGADRIARTAYAALQLLEDLRNKLNKEIPLAWSRHISDVSAIEVYPAATLVAHGIASRGYKTRDGRRERERIVAEIGSKIDIGTKIPELDKSADGLDAIICLLSAHDFLSAYVLTPPEGVPIKKEGWIWVRDPTA